MRESILAFQGEHRFLSNFWPCPCPFGGIVYPSAEHAYQAQKTVNRDTQIVISHAETAGKAKRLGKTVKMRTDWHEVRLAVMERVVGDKFDWNPDLAELLVATGDRMLYEGNAWGDRFWGVIENPDATFGEVVGENWLGRILTITRSRLVLDQG